MISLPPWQQSEHCYLRGIAFYVVTQKLVHQEELYHVIMRGQAKG